MFRNKGTKGFISDEPIPVEEKDKSNFFIESCNKLFGIKEKEAKPDNKGYALYAQNIAKKIKESHFEKSFAIGINGQWGSGKTSMSNLIRRHTQDEKDVISIDFKPWSSSTPDAIIRDFFETLQDELSPYHAALSRLLIRYSRKLTTIDSNVITQTIEYAANYILDLDATNKVYEKINAALKDINKKIIIYIDDLDRLEQNEIMEVIRLIRNTANFYNTYFIVTYDKDYVHNALADAKIHNHEKFLEKIFQLEVNLPYYDKRVLLEELKEKMVEKFPDKQDKIETAIFYQGKVYIDSSTQQRIKEYKIENWLLSSRDVNRLFNSLILNYAPVKDDVLLKDYLSIEILRLYYNPLYVNLFNNRKSFFEIVDGKRYKIRKDYLENYLVNDEKKEDITILLDTIFPEKINTENPLSIYNVKRFPIYFNSLNFTGLLLYREFINAFDEGENHFLNKIEEWVGKDYKDELIKCFSQNLYFKTKEDFKKYTKGLLLAYSLKLEVAGLFIPVNFESTNVETVYKDEYITAITESLSPLNEETKAKLDFLFATYPTYYTDKNVYSRVVYENKKGWKSLEQVHIDVFKIFLDNESKYDETLPVYNRLNTKVNKSHRNRINQLFQEFIIEKDFEGYLGSLIHSGGQTYGDTIDFIINNSPLKFYIIKGDILKNFEELLAFEEALLNKKEDSEIIEEFNEFYHKCQENNFKITDYKFTEIPIKGFLRKKIKETNIDVYNKYLK